MRVCLKLLLPPPKKEWEGHKYNVTNLAEISERISTGGMRVKIQRRKRLILNCHPERRKREIIFSLTVSYSREEYKCIMLRVGAGVTCL